VTTSHHVPSETPRAAALLGRSFGSIPALVVLHGAERPGQPALIQGESQLGYGDLVRGMKRVAAALQREGLGKTDSIAICGATSIDYVVLYLGALLAGLVVAPLSPSSSREALIRMIVDSGAKRLFADPDVARLVGDDPRLPATTSLMDLDAWLDASVPADSEPRAVDVGPDDPFNIIYSSGTTGDPKGIVQPAMMRWMHLVRARANGVGPRSVALYSTPLYSNTTLASFFGAIGVGATSVLMAKFDTRDYLELAQRHRVTHTMLVPVQYRRLLADPGFNAYDLSSFVMKSSTSAPFPAELKAETLRRWPGGLTEVYGMTEGGGTCVLEAHRHPGKLHTVGVPAPGHDVRMIDDAGREVPRGEVGEIVGRSLSMMTGYRNRPAETAEIEWLDGEGRRYIRSGDVGRFDDDGFVTLLDRKKDMIISGGFNVFPSDLEAVLREHRDLLESTVVGVASEQWGETPVAFVVVRPGAAPNAAAIRAWANERLGKMQRLADLRIVERLPRSPIGKVLKRELRDAYRP